MRHDLRRTLLTMAGMAWGIATVVLLLSYGNGFGKAIETIFQSFGATAVGVFPGRTSQQAGGNKAGVPVRFTSDDIELLRNNVPLCRHVVRMAQKDSTVQNNNRSFTFPVMGLDPSIQAIWNLDIAEGRFLNDADNMQHGLYAVIASEARDKLFSGMPAIGESIRIDGVNFEIIGVGAPRMQEGDNDNNRVVYIPYNSMDVLKDNHYLDGMWLDSAGLDHDKLDRHLEPLRKRGAKLDRDAARLACRRIAHTPERGGRRSDCDADPKLAGWREFLDRVVRDSSHDDNSQKSN